MASIETIRRIRVQQISEGADAVRRDLQGLVDAQDKVATATEAAATVTEIASRRQLSASAAYDRLRRSVDDSFKAQQALERGMATANRALQQGATETAAYERTVALLQARYSGAAAEAQRFEAAQRSAARATIAAREAAEGAARATAAQFQGGLNSRFNIGASGGDREADFVAAAAGADRLRAKLDPLFAAQRAYRTDLVEMKGALLSGIISEDAYTAALGRRKGAFAEQIADLGRISAAERTAAAATAAGALATTKATESWRGLSSMGSATLQGLDVSRRMASASAQAEAPDASKAGRLQGYQLQNLAFQGNDILSSLGSGSNLSTVAFQQGPQIAQVFGGPGGATVRGAFAQAGEAATGLASRVGIVGGAIGAVTSIIGTGIAALSSYRQQQRDLDLSVSGMGRASGASASQINSIASGSAGAAGLSVSSAREMAGQFAATGRIGTEMYAGLLTVAKDYAATTRQELPEASKALAEAFADPTKGAEALNAQLGFLDAGMLESIQRFDAQGNRLGAQRVLFDGIAGSVVKASDRLGFFSRQWQEFTTNTSNEFDAIG